MIAVLAHAFRGAASRLASLVVSVVTILGLAVLVLGSLYEEHRHSASAHVPARGRR